MDTTNLPIINGPGSPAQIGSPALCWAVPTHHVHILEMNGKSYRVNRNTDNTALRLKPNRTPPKIHLLIPLSG